MNGWKKELPRDKYLEFLKTAAFHEGKDVGAALVRSDEMCTSFVLDEQIFMAKFVKTSGSAHESRSRSVVAEMDGSRWRIITHKVERHLDRNNYESRTGGAKNGHSAIYAKPAHEGGPVEAPAWTFRTGPQGKTAESFPVDNVRKAQRLGVAKVDFEAKLAVLSVG
jgi:hypothetical protein